VVRLDWRQLGKLVHNKGRKEVLQGKARRCTCVCVCSVSLHLRIWLLTNNKCEGLPLDSCFYAQASGIHSPILGGDSVGWGDSPGSSMGSKLPMRPSLMSFLFFGTLVPMAPPGRLRLVGPVGSSQKALTAQRP
jgi:hypothetical protein